ncbi:MAG: hypothetical protein V4440_03110, partial [Pseudomonadota bacterium]
SGGAGGIIESLSVGAQATEGNGWKFTTAGSTPPYCYNDSERGKVWYNNYGASNTDLDANKAYNFSSSVAENCDIYFSRKVRGVLLTTGSVPFGGADLYQWKTQRMHYQETVSDDSDTNTGLCCLSRRRGHGRQARWENNAGIASGTATGGTVSSLIDSVANFAVNVLKGRRYSVVHSGSPQGGVVASNTATTFAPATSFSPAPVNGDTYSVGVAQDYFGSAGAFNPAANIGWFQIEVFMHTSHIGVADGSYTIRYRKNGVVIDDTVTNIPLYGGSKLYNWLQSQDYWGGYSVPMVRKEVYTDDVVNMAGLETIVLKRFIVTDGLNLDTCNVYESQDYGTWAGNTLAGPHINQGGAAPGNYYAVAASGKNTVLWYRPIKFIA